MPSYPLSELLHACMHASGRAEAILLIPYFLEHPTLRCLRVWHQRVPLLEIGAHMPQHKLMPEAIIVPAHLTACAGCLRRPPKQCRT